MQSVRNLNQTSISENIWFWEKNSLKSRQSSFKSWTIELDVFLAWSACLKRIFRYIWCFLKCTANVAVHLAVPHIALKAMCLDLYIWRFEFNHVRIVLKNIHIGNIWANIPYGQYLMRRDFLNLMESLRTSFFYFLFSFQPLRSRPCYHCFKAARYKFTFNRHCGQ